MKRRIGSLCVALALCLGLLPANVLGYEPQTGLDWGVSILAGDQLLVSEGDDDPAYATTDADGQVTLQPNYTEEDDWNIKWAGSTLTLRNATVRANSIFSSLTLGNEYHIAPIVKLCGDSTTIELEGNNQLIGQSSTGQVPGNCSPIYLAGICVDGAYGSSTGQIIDNSSLVIQGDGTLTIKSSTPPPVSEDFSAISAGIYASGNVTIQGDVTIFAEGEEASASGLAASTGICAEGSVTIQGGATVSAAGAAVKNGSRRAISAGIYAEGSVTIQDGATVSAAGATATSNGTLGSNSADSYGIYGQSVSISDSTVTASSAEAVTSGYTIPDSSGIYARGGIALSGDTTITATGNHYSGGSSGYGPGILINSIWDGSMTVTPPDGKAVLMWTGADADNTNTVVTDDLIQAETTFSPSDVFQTYVQSKVVDLTTPVVTKVTVSPDSSAVLAGETLQFTAQVDGVGDYSQDVTWSLSGSDSASDGTTISADGLLIVAADEQAAQLTVKATSKENPISGTAAVTVDSQVTGITILPKMTEFPLFSSQQFTAVVSGVGNYSKDVTWTVQDNTSNYTTISGTGFLFVHAQETAKTLTIKATSKENPDISGTLTVAVTPNVSAVSISPDSATVSVGETQPFTVKVSGYSDYSKDVTWTVEGNTSEYTTISDDGILTVAENETASTLTVRVTSVQNLSKSDTATVTITSKIEGVTITPSSATVSVGGTQPFSAQVAGGDGVEQTVTWTVSGSDSARDGTSIDETTGLLTVAEDEKSPQLTVKATSPQNPSIFGTATVTVTHTCADKVALIPGKAATCTEPGVQAYYVCSICGKAFEDAECAKEIQNLDDWKVIPAEGHKWSDYEVVDATYHSRTCGVCQTTEQAEHDYTDDQDGTCDTCGYVRWYTVTFDASGGSVTTTSAKTENGKLSTLPTPTWEDYVFLGWYTAPTGGDLVTLERIFISDTTLYARWQEKALPVITVHIDPAEGGSCEVMEIPQGTTDWGQIKRVPLPADGTYTAKEFGSTILLFPQAEPGYILESADYVEIPGEGKDAVNLDMNPDSAYIILQTKRDVTVNLTFREAAGITVGYETLPNGEVCYATTDESGQVTYQPGYSEASPWNVKWDSTTGTLTLRNATIQGTVGGDGSSYGVLYESNLSIVLEGANQVTSADVDTTNGSATSIGIYSKGSLSFSGSGSLTAAGGNSASSIGIAAEGALTFGGQVTVEASGADVSVTGDIDVTKLKWGGRSAGVFSSTSVTVQDASDVTAAGGHYQVSESSTANIGFSVGCLSLRLFVQGGKLTATAQESANGWYGIEAIPTISGGEVFARGNPAIKLDLDDISCTVDPPAGKQIRVLAGSGEALADITGSPFQAQASITSLPGTTFHCYLEDASAHQHAFDGWDYDENSHWHQCSSCGASQGDVTPHVYDNAQDDTCNFCGYQRKLSHAHKGGLVPGTPATCTTDGAKDYYECSVCHQYFEDADCTKPIADLDTWIVIPATGHTWSGTYLKENADAEKHYHVCTVCGAKDAGEAHTWNAEAATEQNDKHCTVCGYVAEAQLGHIHVGTLVPGTPATCTTEGTKAYYTCTCRQAFEDGNCTIPITDLNNWKIIPATGHAWSDTYLKENADAEKHYHVCTVCGAKDAGQAHTWNAEAATEQNDKHCTVCGYVAEAQLEHTHTYGTEWESDENSHWHQCSSCGAKTDVAAHVYDSDQDDTCSVCGYRRQVTPPVGTEFTVNFDANGGDVTPSSAVTTGGKLTSLPTPIRSGYDFAGWYTEPVGGQRVTVNKVFSGNTTIYAHWEKQDSGNSGSINDDSDPTYSITLPGKITGGEITMNKRYAEEGEIFRFTAIPDKGYELNALIVTDSRGRELDLRYEGDSEYSFKMPAGQVEIKASFRQIAVELPFIDTSEDYWAHDEIAWVYENGYMNGTSASSFHPGGTVSRQQVWMILARMAGYYPEDMAAARAWAMANGISDGTNPGGAVTRQQLAALLYRFAVQNGYDASVGESTNILSYTDAGQVSEYAISAMQWACGAGIITGTSADTLSPHGSATRAQLAVMLYRWLA